MLNGPKNELEMEQEIVEMEYSAQLQQIRRETTVEIVLCFIIMVCLIYLMIGVLWLDDWILPLVLLVLAMIAMPAVVAINNRNRRRRAKWILSELQGMKTLTRESRRD